MLPSTHKFSLLGTLSRKAGLFVPLFLLLLISPTQVSAQSTIQECNLSNPQCPSGTTCKKQQFQSKAYCVATQTPTACDSKNPQCPSGKICKKEQFQSTGYCVDAPPTYNTCDPSNPQCPSGKICKKEQFQSTGYCVDPPPTYQTCDPNNPSCPTGKVCRKEQFQSTGYCVDPAAVVIPSPNCQDGETVNTAVGEIPTCNLNAFAAWFMGWAVGIGGGIAFLLILMGGFRIMSSGGNPDQIKAGKEQLTSAITGLLFIIFSVFLLQLIGVEILRLPGFGK